MTRLSDLDFYASLWLSLAAQSGRAALVVLQAFR